MQKTNSTYDNAMINFLINPKNRVYRYLLLILCVVVVAVNAALLSVPYDYNIAFVYSIGLLIIYLSLIYLNIKILVPRYLLQNRYWIYIGILTILALFTIAIDLTIEFYIKTFFNLNFGKFSILERKDDFVLNIIATCFLYVTCFAGTSIGVLFKHWLASARQVNQLEKNTIGAELQQLKSQIYPDFLFGTLEKAGEQATLNSKKTSDILMKLSKFLRYQLYDSTRNEVLLISEISSLENLLNLKKEQLNGFMYSIITDENIKQVLVPPLLFVSIVLHTIDSIKNYEKMSFINLSFGIKNKSLEFTCSGTKSGKLTDIEDTLNIKRRLDLLFGENYRLDFSEDERSHTIYLCLNVL